MTLVMNRADRIHARRVGALRRLSASLLTGIRFTGMIGDCSHDATSRARADRESLTLMERTAKAPAVTFTRKKLTAFNCSEARKARRRGKIN